jgi:hypothetical protein
MSGQCLGERTLFLSLKKRQQQQSTVVQCRHRTLPTAADQPHRHFSSFFSSCSNTPCAPCAPSRRRHRHFACLPSPFCMAPCTGSCHPSSILHSCLQSLLSFLCICAQDSLVPHPPLTSNSAITPIRSQARMVMHPHPIFIAILGLGTQVLQTTLCLNSGCSGFCRGRHQSSSCPNSVHPAKSLLTRPVSSIDSSGFGGSASRSLLVLAIHSVTSATRTVTTKEDVSDGHGMILLHVDVLGHLRQILSLRISCLDKPD